jgi:hypothetical protein
MTLTATTHYLYCEGEKVRPATPEEVQRSDEAALIDGGYGFITVDGVTCYTA